MRIIAKIKIEGMMPGKVVEVPDELGERLIARKMAVRVPEPKPEPAEDKGEE